MIARNLLTALFVAAAAAAAQADDPADAARNVRTVTAAEVANLPDDTHVRVEGHIVRSLGGEEYEFRDDTGTLRVEIDDDDWDGQLDPNRRVILLGELDQDADGPELEVDRVEPAGG